MGHIGGVALTPDYGTIRCFHTRGEFRSGWIGGFADPSRSSGISIRPHTRSAIVMLPRVTEDESDHSRTLPPLPVCPVQCVKEHCTLPIHNHGLVGLFGVDCSGGTLFLCPLCLCSQEHERAGPSFPYMDGPQRLGGLIWCGTMSCFLPQPS